MTERLALSVLDVREAGAQVGERGHEDHRIERRWIESQSAVEGDSIVRERMDEETTNADGVGREDDPSRRVLKKRSAKAMPVARLIHREPRKDNDRDRIRHVAAESTGRFLDADGARGEGVARDDSIRLADDERARCAACLIGVRAALEPVIQGRFAAREGVELVVRAEGFRRR